MLWKDTCTTLMKWLDIPIYLYIFALVFFSLKNNINNKWISHLPAQNIFAGGGGGGGNEGTVDNI